MRKRKIPDKLTDQVIDALNYAKTYESPAMSHKRIDVNAKPKMPPIPIPRRPSYFEVQSLLLLFPPSATSRLGIIRRLEISKRMSRNSKISDYIESKIRELENFR